MQYYDKEIEEVLEILKTNKDGLTKVESSHRLGKYGENVLLSKSKINPLKIFLNQFKSSIIYILLFAVVLTILLKHYTDSILIIIILVANAVIGFFQEYSAQKSLEALKQLGKTNAKVYRDLKLIEIDSKYLVPGDIIYLEAGDKVPADCRIIESSLLKVEESSLTGESSTINKNSEKILKKSAINEQKNMLFSSSSIALGTAKAIVVYTGMNTQVGYITKLVDEAKEQMTPLQEKLDIFGKKLAYIIVFICLFIFFILILTKGYSLENLIIFGLVAVSLAVAAVPTALPAVVTITLSVGVKRLLKKNVLVRNLSSVETLGSCDVICTDKTGTLTQNQMTVREAWTLDKNASVDGVGYNPVGYISEQLNPLLFKIGLFCNNSSLYKENGIWKISGDPSEAALIVSARKFGFKEKEAYNRLDEIPFDSSRKLMSVLCLENNNLISYVKGAPDQLLEKCAFVIKNGKKVKISKEIKNKILEQNILYAKKALRVLAFAYKECKSKEDFNEENLVFVGLQAMIDPPRPDVIDAVKKTKEANIRTIMITGDYKETALAIGREIGIEGLVLSGLELDEMSDNDLKKALKNNTNIFARVIPEHKQRIVSALQDLGHIVAMTGDGVNDAPALKKANIGVAVGSGTDVAKEAADFVLLDDSFTNIVNAIEEGRGIYDNIQKTIMHLLSGNLGEVLIIFLAVILGFNLPLTAILLLWINLITDGAPALAFSVDPYNKNIMKRKPIKDKSILPKDKLILIAVLGFISSLIALFLFKLFGGSGNDLELELAQTMIFTYVVISEIILIFIIRNQYKIKQFTNSYLWFAILFSILMQIFLIFTPLREIFNLQVLGFVEIIAIFLAGIIFFISYLIYSKYSHPQKSF